MPIHLVVWVGFPNRYLCRLIDSGVCRAIWPSKYINTCSGFQESKFLGIYSLHKVATALDYLKNCPPGLWLLFLVFSFGRIILWRNDWSNWSSKSWNLWINLKQVRRRLLPSRSHSKVIRSTWKCSTRKRTSLSSARRPVGLAARACRLSSRSSLA